MLRKIEKSTELHAGSSRVWDVLTKDEYTRQWWAAFMPGTQADTDWSLGSRVVFTDSNGDGIAGTITENIPERALAITYDAMVFKGQEDRESDMAKSFAGSVERYELNERNGSTRLDISCDMDEEHYDMMSAQWDEALKIFKRLAEQN